MQRLILVTLALGLLVDMLIDIAVPDRVMTVIFVVVLLFISYKETLWGMNASTSRGHHG